MFGSPFEKSLRSFPKPQPASRVASKDKPKPASRVASNDKEKTSAQTTKKPMRKVNEQSSNSKIALAVPAEADKPMLDQKIEESEPSAPTQQEIDDDDAFSIWFTNKQEEAPFQTLPVLKNRFGRMLDEKFRTDVVFITGPNEEKLEAHRLILASASPIFEQLLYNAEPLLEDDKFVLHEREYSIPTIQVFVKAIYTGEVPICLALDQALDVFYVAKKYDVKFLQKVVLEHLNQVVTTANVFEALAVSTKMMELTSMIPTCWRIIEEQTSAVLEHHIDSMDMHTFSRILERDQLSIDEVNLFLYLLRWATLRCKRRGLKTTARSKRQMMEPLLKLIRFPTMSAKDFNERVIPTRILDSAEINAIMPHMLGLDHKTVVPYNLNPRRKPQKTRQIYSGCYSAASGTSKGLIKTSSSLSQVFGSESDITLRTWPKTEMNQYASHTPGRRTSTTALTDLNETLRTPRIKKSKKTKGHIRDQE